MIWEVAQFKIPLSLQQIMIWSGLGWVWNPYITCSMCCVCSVTHMCGQTYSKGFSTMPSVSSKPPYFPSHFILCIFAYSRHTGLSFTTVSKREIRDDWLYTILACTVAFANNSWKRRVFYLAWKTRRMRFGQHQTPQIVSEWPTICWKFNQIFLHIYR